MARIEAGFLMIAIPGLIVFGLFMLARLIIRRRLQADLARTAPDLLRFEDINPQIREHLLEQRKALKSAERMMSKLLADPAVLIPSEYADPMQQWIDNNPKEIS